MIRQQGSFVKQLLILRFLLSSIICALKILNLYCLQIYFNSQEQAYQFFFQSRMKMIMPPFRSQPKTMTWVELPKSKYGIEYVLGGIPGKQLHLANVDHGGSLIKFWKNSRHKKSKRPSKSSPFETMLHSLDEVTRRDGNKDGTALMYIREIFEPGDVEYDYIGDYVCATQLSFEQVNRLRILVLPQRREEILLIYLDHFDDRAEAEDNVNFKNIPFNESTDVLQHFESFQQRYLSIFDPKTKFDLLFGFSFAIKHHSSWIFKYESQRKRESMVSSLARHWRNLIARNSAADLGKARLRILLVFF